MAAYAAGSEHVGEVLREIADEGVSVGLPIAALIEARTTVADHEAVLLDVLAALPYTVVLPLDDVDGWQRLAAATQLLGGLGRACAALAVTDGIAGYVMTREPGVYGGIETIPIGDD